MSPVQSVKAKVQGAWSLAKRLFVLTCLWGLVFSLVTIGKLGVAFDYDDTLVFSSPAYARAFAQTPQPFTDKFWTVVNQSYDLEKPKFVSWGLAWLFRICGFRVSILSGRPDTAGENLRKEWRRLVPRQRFIFVGDKGSKAQFIKEGNIVVFFGDGDTDIEAGRRARVLTLRIRRSPKSNYKDDYHPGTFGEFVIPFSEY